MFSHSGVYLVRGCYRGRLPGTVAGCLVAIGAGGASGFAESRMRSWSHSEAGRYAFQQVEQLVALFQAEGRADLFLVSDCSLERLVEQLPSSVGEAEFTNPAIGGIRPPLEQPSALEFIDDRDHAAPWDLELVAQRPLGETLLEADRAQ